MTDTKRIRPALGLATAAALLALAACGGGSGSADEAAASDEPTSQESEAVGQAQGPDMEGIPNVVAEVNGQEVTKDEFVPLYQAQYQQAAGQAQAGGEQPDEDALKQKTADNLVDTTLLAQEAKARGIAVTDQDVEDKLASLAEQNQFGSVEELLAALETQGATEDQARAQVESQLVIDKLVTDEAGKFEPSEQVLRKIYQQAKQQQAQAGEQGQTVPPYAEVKSQLEQQAKFDRLAKVAQALIDALRKDADITINL